MDRQARVMPRDLMVAKPVGMVKVCETFGIRFVNRLKEFSFAQETGELPNSSKKVDIRVDSCKFQTSHSM
jgi:hypothetical protein